jgi:hypothetical protein
MPAVIRPLILSIALAQPAFAGSEAERQAWVLATTSQDGTALALPSTDAIAVSRRLMAAGFTVTRRENADPSALPLTVGRAQIVVLYFSGPVTTLGNETWLLSGSAQIEGPPQGWPLFATVRALRDGGAQQVVAVIEGCHVAGEGFAALPEGQPQTTGAETGPSPYPGDVVFLFSAPPGQPCAASDAAPRLTDRVVAALATPGNDFLSALESLPGQGWIEARLNHRLPPLVPALPAAANAGSDLLRSLPVAEAERLKAAWGATAVASDLLIVGPETTLPAGPPSPSSGSDSGLALIPVSATRIAARPTPAGLPRPSVIVGEIGNGTNPPDSAAASAQSTLGSLGREERLAMRASDPVGFDSLVDSGAFDPAPADIITALQTELRDSRCYSGAIDGDWGPGSRAATAAFFQERKSEVPSTDPDLVLFRAILAGEPVECPVRAVAAPAASAGSGSSGSGGSRSSTAASSGGGAAAPAPAPAKSAPKIDANAVGLVIR